MSQIKISLQEFIDSYKESLGIEGAEQLIKQSIQRANFTEKSEFTKQEALKICRELKQHSGFIGLIGGILHSRIMIR